MSCTAGLEFHVEKSAWQESRFVETEVETELAAGQVLFRVDRFAFTANNISYAMAGDLLGYWNFFPKEEGWGCLPTMGFGDVIASRHEGVPLGTRCFGFFPMAKHLRIEPAVANAGSIVDGAAHRSGLSPAYNQYQPVTSDALYAPEFEDALALTRGLFLTSFLADDFLGESGHHGAQNVVISSASSKTSIALAFVVSRHGRARAVGLTSAKNRAFVESLGFYDRVLAYDEIDTLPEVPSVFVDMAGNDRVTRAVHERLGTQLKFSQRIGGTHWDAAGDDVADLPGPERQFFFAPAQIKKRIGEWGPEGFAERLGTSLRSFLEASEKWLQVERGFGRDAVERVYRATLEGRARPDQGHILSLWEDEGAAS